MTTRYVFRYEYDSGNVATLDWGDLVANPSGNPLLLNKDRNSFADVKAYIEGAAPNGLNRTIDIDANSLDILIRLFVPDGESTVPPVGRGVTGENVSLDTTNFNNNLDSSIVNVQLLADRVDELSGATPPPVPGPNDFRYGLSIQSDPALVDFGSLTDVANPTDPVTVSTGVTTAGQYFHIFSANTHDIQTITDTVLSQIVYQDGGTGNIFTKVSDSRTESSVTYDAYTIGPLNAGVDEEYIVRFS